VTPAAPQLSLECRQRDAQLFGRPAAIAPVPLQGRVNLEVRGHRKPPNVV